MESFIIRRSVVVEAEQLAGRSDQTVILGLARFTQCHAGPVQHLLHQRSRRKFDGILSRLTFSHALARLVGDLLANRFVALAQCCDNGCDLLGTFDRCIATYFFVE